LIDSGFALIRCEEDEEVKDNTPQTAHKAGEDVIKAFVNEDGNTTLFCPKCSAVKTVSAEQYRGRLHNLKIRCNCAYVFVVNLDFRQNYRKKTDLAGSYVLFEPASGKGEAHIQDLSLDGASFVITSWVRGLEVGSRGRLEFTLDDKKKTRLVREFVVQHLKDNTVGCRFRKDQAFAKELGFYLRFGP